VVRHGSGGADRRGGGFAVAQDERHALCAQVRDAVAEMDRRAVDFEYDGEMAADVALDPELMKLYPFCRLSGPANVLVMPALHTAHVSSKLLKQLGGGTVIGPLMVGLAKPIQIVTMDANVSDMLNAGAIAADTAGR